MKRLFIDGLGGMAQGLFATLIIGTIIQQIGTFIGGGTGDVIFLIGKTAAALTGAGIGAGVARKLDAGHLVIVSAAVVGIIGAFASGIRSGSLFVDGSMVLSGPGEPLGAFVAAYVAIELGVLISGKTKLDIILTPLACIGVGSAVGLSDQLGNRAAAVPHGSCRVCSHGNDPDSSDQFGCSWRDPESFRSGGRRCYGRLLLQYDRIRRSELA